MGWSSGGELMEKVIKSAIRHIGNNKPSRHRLKFYKEMIVAFEEHDCDVLYECKGQDKIFDQAFNELHPDEDNQ